MEIIKMCKKSRRGLTFSYPSEGALAIGNAYDYVIDKAAQNIRIEANEAGRYKVSRKQVGATWRSLVDLRNKEVMDVLEQMDSIRISIGDGTITVSNGAAKERGVLLLFPRKALADLRLAVGMNDISAV